MEQYYKYVVNFFKVADPQKIIKGEYLESFGTYVPSLPRGPNNGFYGRILESDGNKRKHQFLPYAFEAIEYQSAQVSCRPGIMAGLYFPNATPGQKIQIKVGTGIVSEITITNPSKIYLPIDNLLMLYDSYLGLNTIEIIGTFSQKWYIINLFVNMNIAKSIVYNTHCHRIYNKEYCFRYNLYGGIVKNKICNKCTFHGHLDYHANKIKNFLKSIVKAKKQKWTSQVVV